VGAGRKGDAYLSNLGGTNGFHYYGVKVKEAGSFSSQVGIGVNKIPPMEEHTDL